MTHTERDSFNRWLKGIPYEIAFWKSYYGHKSSLEQLFSWSSYGEECQLDNFDIQAYAASCPGKPRFVDLGCSLSYTFGTEFPSKPVCIERIDPLATFYNRILDKSRIDRPKIKFGMIENISTIYEPGSIDLIHIRNALDHCANPMLGIIECLACLRNGNNEGAGGGILYLHHHRNEAEGEAYRGFHQYNIDSRNGQLVLWNRDACIDVADALKGIATVQCSVTEHNHIVAVIQKTGNVPPSMHSPEASARRAAEMLEMTIKAFNSPLFALKYHMAVFTSSLAHPVMRRIPRRLVDTLKAFLAKRHHT